MAACSAQMSVRRGVSGRRWNWAEPWLLAFPSTVAVGMSAGRVGPGQAGAAGVSLDRVSAPSVPGPRQCCWDVPGDTGLPDGHSDCVLQGSGGHWTSQGVGQVISMTTSQHHGGRQHVAVATGNIPGASALAFGFSCCFGDPLMPSRRDLWKLWAAPRAWQQLRELGGGSPGCR